MFFFIFLKLITFINITFLNFTLNLKLILFNEILILI